MGQRPPGLVGFGGTAYAVFYRKIKTFEYATFLVINK